VGALSVLGGAVLPWDLVADAGSVLLVMDRDALFGVLEEHGHVAPVPPQALAARLLDASASRPWTPPPPRPPPTVRLDLVSRMLTLRDALGLGMDGMATIARLARVARARQYEAGSILASEDGRPTCSFSSRVRWSSPPPKTPPNRFPWRGAGVRAGGRRVAVGWPVVATSDSTALVLPHRELAEDIEDDDMLCLELIKSFAEQLWLALKAAEVRPEALGTSASV
jgi:hypothetical protein